MSIRKKAATKKSRELSAHVVWSVTDAVLASCIAHCEDELEWWCENADINARHGDPPGFTGDDVAAVWGAYPTPGSLLGPAMVRWIGDWVGCWGMWDNTKKFSGLSETIRQTELRERVRGDDIEVKKAVREAATLRNKAAKKAAREAANAG